MTSNENQKLSLFALTSMVVGSMVGAGIFNLPGRFATATGPFGAIIAWAIAGTGMYMLARVFQALAEKRPDIDSGVFAYAKAGFGNYMGFLSAFGYWLGSCLGNVFYWVLIGSTLGRFFPGIFGDGSSAIAIIVSLIGIWAFHFMILRGVEQATFINTVVTIAKIVPILVFILLLIFFFHFGQFRENFFGGLDMPPKSLIAQVRDTMLITVFVFLGIEGASVYSRFAKVRSDVGTATILGFVGVTGLMVAVTLLPYAALPQSAVAGVQQPSMAGVLEAVVGHWGAVFISIGVLISVLGAYLAWSLICAEVLFAAAKSEDMPRLFAAQNGNKVPANALWLTNIVVSLFVISTYWSRDAFNFMLDMTSVTALLPYLLVAGYGILLARSGVGYEKTPDQRGRDQIFAWIAAIYTVFMFVAAGLKYVLLVAVLFAPGTILYVWARREQKLQLFTLAELFVFAVTLIAGLIGAYGLLTGAIAP
ncbi:MULTISPECIES: basic amino acid/polyamine antiporter [unclassified Mesorhizobium]|uniref:basic amino acid/polyamine antiporter n=1 Tax=unclassified Mesorhizobium TaxID=325217 RepID=UPI00112E4E84|nr:MULTISPECIES: basic amino acid/polyamine antiporter [unclassified Mesorhizobium]MBZ9895669.1 basic amino acid/polyamine antiporter [Mesorhizobium sp. BR1-1-6]MBZ9983303.1 basic amino acid/polyamine antiporter [Mesorhizobium sp. BR-1-1-8]MCA0025634.1 basic amino acid/polyamine antiporter [Mesorhizobium sp. B263B1A]MCA0056486.1 basic amino acid/polyamine antiporter [Mesorhizobium sp. B261B1A]TPI53525.1 amino acid permease [Mesorhizobium sp. B3-1-1]